MIHFETPGRSEKSKARTNVMARHERPSKAALMLPGVDAACVKEGLATGRFDADTFLIYVEKDADAFNTLCPRIQDLGFKRHHPHFGPLEKLQLRSVLNGRMLDFAFLDLCGHLTSSVAKWTWANFNASTICRGARISATFGKSRSRGTFIDDIGNGLDLGCYKLRSRTGGGVQQITTTAFVGLMEKTLDVRITDNVDYCDTSAMFCVTLDVSEVGTSPGYEARMIREIYQSKAVREALAASKENTKHSLFKAMPAELPPWQKMIITKLALNKGIKPEWESDEHWRTCPLNPESINNPYRFGEIEPAPEPAPEPVPEPEPALVTAPLVEPVTSTQLEKLLTQMEGMRLELDSLKALQGASLPLIETPETPETPYEYTFSGKPVEVFNVSTKKTVVYPSIKAAAAAHNIQKSTVKSRCTKSKIYKGTEWRYVLTPPAVPVVPVAPVVPVVPNAPPPLVPMEIATLPKKTRYLYLDSDITGRRPVRVTNTLTGEVITYSSISDVVRVLSARHEDDERDSDGYRKIYERHTVQCMCSDPEKVYDGFTYEALYDDEKFEYLCNEYPGSVHYK